MPEAINSMPSQHWAKHFTVTDDDLEYLSEFLLVTETPLKIDALARELIQRRLNEQAATLADKYRDVQRYDPAATYQVGQKLLFAHLGQAVGTVTTVRPGNNPDVQGFSVIEVAFEQDDSQPDVKQFAAQFPGHALSQQDGDDMTLPGTETLTADDILAGARDAIVRPLEEKLHASDDIVSIAGLWFPQSLVLDVNEGHLNLCEAVLDISEGGPLSTQDLIEQIGGVGSAPMDLQVFSLNLALSQDDRFDEVGPKDQVLWFLKRAEPQEITTVPAFLRYSPINYDEALLSADMLALEAAIDDEWSDVEDDGEAADEVTVTLAYPHRRAGTLPLNARMRRIFPTARRTARIYVTLVDGQDGEEFPGWVVRKERYVLGLAKFYKKHRLPVGAFIHVSHGDAPGKIIVNFNAYKPRTEYITLIVPKDNRMTFQYDRRSIGAEYDDLMIFGVDDLAGLDEFVAQQAGKKSLGAILHNLVTELSRTSPQGTVHARMLYSTANVLRRVPPGPIFAELVSSEDFEEVGNNYWKLASR
jgi:hypothetical protein